MEVTSNCYTYILYSSELDQYYVVHTCENLEKRIRKHLSYHKCHTSIAKDWKLVYKESFENKILAYRREREIKSWKSRKKIEELISSAGYLPT